MTLTFQKSTQIEKTNDKQAGFLNPASQFTQYSSWQTLTSIIMSAISLLISFILGDKPLPLAPHREIQLPIKTVSAYI